MAMGDDMQEAENPFRMAETKVNTTNELLPSQFPTSKATPPELSNDDR